MISVGRLEKQKDFDYLINHFENTEFSLDIVGDGSLRNELQKLASTNKNIRFHGKVNHDVLLNLLSKYVIYLSASELEGSPKSILEAMSQGCIVFTPNSPNVSEILKHNMNGVIYKKEGSDLINKLNELIADDVKVKTLQKNSIDWVSKNCTLEILSKLEFDDYLFALK